MLPRAGLGDEAGLPHLLGQQSLAQDVIDLMGSGVIEVLPLEVDFRAAQVLGHFFRIVQPGGTPGVLVEQLRQFPVKLRVVFIVLVGLFQFNHRVHQGLGDVLSPVDPEAALGICHTFSSFRTAATKAAIL